jgi:hypothetical protein
MELESYEFYIEKDETTCTIYDTTSYDIEKKAIFIGVVRISRN